jgi:hypothetical protein
MSVRAAIFAFAVNSPPQAAGEKAGGFGRAFSH